MSVMPPLNGGDYKLFVLVLVGVGEKDLDRFCGF
jgi:hypothetical protein